MTNPNFFTSVLKSLQENRGRLREVAAESGVPYSTVSKISQGITRNPGVLCVEKLAAYFSKKA